MLQSITIMTKKISLPLVFTVINSCLLLSFFFFTMGSVQAQNQVHDTRLPPILPGQTVGNQVVITTAGPVVGQNDALPPVPTDRTIDQKFPPGLLVDTRKDYLDATKQGGQETGHWRANPVIPQDKSADLRDEIPLPVLPTEPDLK